MSKWYEKTLEEKSNIIYSRIRLARNWDEYVFPSRLDEAEGSWELVDGLKDGLKEIPYFTMLWKICSRQKRKP